MKQSTDNGYPTQREYRPTLWEFPRRSALLLVLSSFATVAVVGTYLYADNAYPHGPQVLQGYDIECANDGRGPCREVPLYSEDTSVVDNPGWVMFMVHGRGELLMVGSVLFILWAAFVHGPQMWLWWKPRRRLVWPHHHPSSLEVVLTAIDSDLDGWKWSHEAGRILYGMGRHTDALALLGLAKEEDLGGLHEQQVRAPEFAKQIFPQMIEEAEQWHAENISYVRDRMSGAES